MPNLGDELHHTGWNACSSCHGDATAQRRYACVCALIYACVWALAYEQAPFTIHHTPFIHLHAYYLLPLTHPHSRYLILPAVKSGRIYAVDVANARAPKLHKILEGEKIAEVWCHTHTHTHTHTHIHIHTHFPRPLVCPILIPPTAWGMAVSW